MVREIGALMTGIIIAGRTGSAFAAKLGTMQVNEDFDAFRTLGISPIDFLVLPRILALMLMVPLLTLYSGKPPWPRSAGAADRVEKFAAADSRIIASIIRAGTELANAARTLEQLVDEESPAIRQFTLSLQEISRTARALRLLAESLEQQPERICDLVDPEPQRGNSAAATAGCLPGSGRAA